MNKNKNLRILLEACKRINSNEEYKTLVNEKLKKQNKTLDELTLNEELSFFKIIDFEWNLTHKNNTLNEETLDESIFNDYIACINEYDLPLNEDYRHLKDLKKNYLTDEDKELIGNDILTSVESLEERNLEEDINIEFEMLNEIHQRYFDNDPIYRYNLKEKLKNKDIDSLTQKDKIKLMRELIVNKKK